MSFCILNLKQSTPLWFLPIAPAKHTLMPDENVSTHLSPQESFRYSHLQKSSELLSHVWKRLITLHTHTHSPLHTMMPASGKYASQWKAFAVCQASRGREQACLEELRADTHFFPGKPAPQLVSFSESLPGILQINLVSCWEHQCVC